MWAGRFCVFAGRRRVLHRAEIRLADEVLGVGGWVGDGTGQRQTGLSFGKKVPNSDS